MQSLSQFNCPSCSKVLNSPGSNYPKLRCGGCSSVLHNPFYNGQQTASPQQQSTGNNQFQCPGCGQVLQSPGIHHPKARCGKCSQVVLNPFFAGNSQTTTSPIPPRQNFYSGGQQKLAPIPPTTNKFRCPTCTTVIESPGQTYKQVKCGNCSTTLSNPYFVDVGSTAPPRESHQDSQTRRLAEDKERQRQEIEHRNNLAERREQERIARLKQEEDARRAIQAERDEVDRLAKEAREKIEKEADEIRKQQEAQIAQAKKDEERRLARIKKANERREARLRKEKLQHDEQVRKRKEQREARAKKKEQENKASARNKPEGSSNQTKGMSELNSNADPADLMLSLMTQVTEQEEHPNNFNKGQIQEMLSKVAVLESQLPPEIASDLFKDIRARLEPLLRESPPPDVTNTPDDPTDERSPPFSCPRCSNTLTTLVSEKQVRCGGCKVALMNPFYVEKTPPEHDKSDRKVTEDTSDKFITCPSCATTLKPKQGFPKARCPKCKAVLVNPYFVAKVPQRLKTGKNDGQESSNLNRRSPKPGTLEQSHSELTDKNTFGVSQKRPPPAGHGIKSDVLLDSSYVVLCDACDWSVTAQSQLHGANTVNFPHSGNTIEVAAGGSGGVVVMRLDTEYTRLVTKSDFSGTVTVDIADGQYLKLNSASNGTFTVKDVVTKKLVWSGEIDSFLPTNSSSDQFISVKRSTWANPQTTVKVGSDTFAVYVNSECVEVSSNGNTVSMPAKTDMWFSHTNDTNLAVDFKGSVHTVATRMLHLNKSIVIVSRLAGGLYLGLNAGNGVILTLASLAR